MMQVKICYLFNATKETGNGHVIVSAKSLPVQIMFAEHDIVQTSPGLGCH